jgi:predicted RNA-binding protein associated with RNAse of E/G family
MNEQIRVHKLDEHGQEVWSYPAEVLEQNPTRLRLEARFDRSDIAVGPLLLRQNDRFIETFFFDRWYNIFEVFDGENSRFKGWYCNIARPAWLEGEHLYAEDLALDLVVTPDGHFEILDRDEFDRLELSEVDRLQALRALHLLQEQALTRSGIFADHTEV